MADAVPIVVFCHLRWNFVYQRPQHLLSRLATQRSVLFIEEPVHSSDGAWLEHQAVAPNLTVVRPHTPAPWGGFNDAQAPYLAPLVAQLLAERGWDEYAVWLYTPMALPVARALQPQAVAYDCMDELSAFRFAPAELLDRERELLEWADVVFTGGPSLYRAKQGRHANLHCFPSSVDAAHFAQASAGISEPADQASLPHPRLGFYGVIDERLDVALVDGLAAAHPEWQIVLVGPVAKIDPATLPQHPNLHYFGQRDYSELPAFLAGWDVCLLPFARNDATKYISPTKTLEYMAAERPIVSTPITDVAEPYSHIVYLGDDLASFGAACARALAAPAAERAERSAAMRQVLATTSWDRTARAMGQLVDEAVARQRNHAPSFAPSMATLEDRSITIRA